MAHPAMGLLAFAGALSITALQAWTITVDTSAPRALTSIASTQKTTTAIIAVTKSAFAARRGQVGVAEEIVITGTIDGSVADRILIKAVRSMKAIAVDDALPDIESFKIAEHQ
jgi:hypothetical protein